MSQAERMARLEQCLSAALILLVDRQRMLAELADMLTDRKDIKEFHATSVKATTDHMLAWAKSLGVQQQERPH